METSAPLESLSATIRERQPEVAIVLGSGLGAVAARVRADEQLPFAQIPELAATTVAGHEGQLILGEWSGVRVLVFSGRLHAYEGHALERVVAPIHLATRLGAKRIILTNAAGGIRDDLVPGTLMVATALLDCTRPWPLHQVVKRAEPCSKPLAAALNRAAGDTGITLALGTYAAVTGPNYETPAEIRALRALGADAVGMSTAAEAIAASHLGLECAAISCITNRAAGLGTQRLSHEEVLRHSQQQAGQLGEVLERFLHFVTHLA